MDELSDASLSKGGSCCFSFISLTKQLKLSLFCSSEKCITSLDKSFLNFSNAANVNINSFHYYFLCGALTSILDIRMFKYYTVTTDT